ncbi:hypothetical protein [Tahibacter caeni]|uniref:hypothetical protein n=1 Tax=Tahibacter caeni TaxID=1453545 RepID=UPI0021485920|nr:hypothetical protein [Tahibacter caeni]
MKFLPTAKQSLILLALMALMLVTRYHHLGSALHLPDASMAIFFVAGFYLAGTVALPLLLLEAGLIDYIAISLAGVSDFCVTPAYSMLVVAYGVLWYGGAFYAKKLYKPQPSTALPAGLIALASCLLSFLVSNGSFYWMGGRVADANLADYVQNFLRYMPSFVGVALAYIAVFGLAHAIGVVALGERQAGAKQA